MRRPAVTLQMEGVMLSANILLYMVSVVEETLDNTGRKMEGDSGCIKSMSNCTSLSKPL